MDAHCLPLNNGTELPVLGFGTCHGVPPIEIDLQQQAVEFALQCGIRHLDCAYLYGNLEVIGRAIQNKLADNTVSRRNLFVTDKIWSTFHQPKDVRPALLTSLKQLNLDYLDLYLMHLPNAFVNNGEMFPMDKDGKIINDKIDYLETWKEMEALQKEGLVRSIGVSNFNEYQINRLLSEGSIPPAVNQVENHPYFQQGDLVNFCQTRNVQVVAYAPLGASNRAWAKKEEPTILDDPVLHKIATKLNKTPAQVALRFQIQRGVAVIPKSVTPSRIESNFQIFDFELSSDDMSDIFKLERNFRSFRFEYMSDHKYFPFNENYSE